MRVISHVVLNDEQEYPREYLSNEVILVHNLFSNYKPGEIYAQRNKINTRRKIYLKMAYFI